MRSTGWGAPLFHCFAARRPCWQHDGGPTKAAESSKSAQAAGVTKPGARRRRSRYLSPSRAVRSDAARPQTPCDTAPSKLAQKPVAAAWCWRCCTPIPDPWFDPRPVERGLKFASASPLGQCARPDLESLAIDPGDARYQKRCPNSRRACTTALPTLLLLLPLSTLARLKTPLSNPHCRPVLQSRFHFDTLDTPGRHPHHHHTGPRACEPTCPPGVLLPFSTTANGSPRHRSCSCPSDAAHIDTLLRLHLDSLRKP